MVFPFALEDCYTVTSDAYSADSGDSNFNTKDGYQVKAVKAMMDRVLSPKDPSFDFDENVVSPSAFA